MNRDIVVKTNLDATEFLALRQMADDHGLSQSSMVRMLICREIAAHTNRLLRAQLDDSLNQGRE